MTTHFLCGALLVSSISFNTVSAQQASASASGSSYAYANGNESYLRFTKPTYEKGKKYTVYNIRKAGETLSAEQQAKTEQLKKQLVKKGVAFVDVPWTVEADLATAMKQHDIDATVTTDSHMKLKGKTFNLNTTSGDALVVIGEENKAVSLCSGAQCEERLKTFFGLTALN